MRESAAILVPTRTIVEDMLAYKAVVPCSMVRTPARRAAMMPGLP